MATIMQKPQNNIGIPDFSYKSIGFVRFPSTGKQRTLNGPFRKNQLRRIAQQNRGILRRLQGKKSEYSTFQMQQAFCQNQKRVKNLCEFPHIIGKYHNNKSSGRSTMRKNINTESAYLGPAGPVTALDEIGYEQPQQQYIPPQTQSQLYYNMNSSVRQQSPERGRITGSIQSEGMTSHATPFVRGGLPIPTKSKFNMTGGFQYGQDNPDLRYQQQQNIPQSSAGRYLPPIQKRKNKKVKPLDFRNINLDQNRVVLYKHSQLLAERYVTIQISRNSKKFFIVAFDLDERKPHLIDLTDKQAQKLIGECQNSIEFIVQRLDFTAGGKFVIRDWNKLDYTSSHNTQYYLQQQSQQERSGSVSAGQSASVTSSRQKKFNTGRASSNMRSTNNNGEHIAVARSDDLRRYNKIRNQNNNSKIQEEDQGDNVFFNTTRNHNVRSPPEIDLFERGLNVIPPVVNKEGNQDGSVKQSQEMEAQNQEKKEVEDEEGNYVAKVQEKDQGKDQEKEEQNQQQERDQLMIDAREVVKKDGDQINSGMKPSTSQDYYQDEFQKIETQRERQIDTVSEKRSRDEESNITGIPTIPHSKLDSNKPQTQQDRLEQKEEQEQENKEEEKEEQDQEQERQHLQEADGQSQAKQNQSLSLPFEHLQENVQKNKINATTIQNQHHEYRKEQKQIEKQTDQPSDIIFNHQSLENQNPTEEHVINYQNEMPAVPFDQGVSTIKPLNTSIQNTREHQILESIIQRNQQGQLNASSPNIDNKYLSNISEKHPESLPLSPQQKINEEQQNHIQFTQFQVQQNGNGSVEQQSEDDNNKLKQQDQNKEENALPDDHQNQKQLIRPPQQQQNLEPDNEDDFDDNEQLPNLIADQLQFSSSEQTPINKNTEHITKTVPGSVIQKSISIKKEGSTPPQYGDLTHQELAHIQQISYHPSPIVAKDGEVNNDDDDDDNEKGEAKPGQQDQIIAQSYADRDLPSDLRKDLMKNEPLSKTHQEIKLKGDDDDDINEQDKTAILVEEEEQKQRKDSQDQQQKFTHVQREEDQQSLTAQRGQSPRDPDDILEKMSNPQQERQQATDGQAFNQFEMLENNLQMQQENENEKLDAIPEEDQVENGTPSPVPDMNQNSPQHESETMNKQKKMEQQQKDKQSETSNAKGNNNVDEAEQEQIIKEKQNIGEQTDSDEDYGNYDE